MYGRRARLGVLVPSRIVATEPEFGLMTPEGVSCHFHRISFTGDGIENLRKMEAGIAEATRIILHVKPAAMAMTGTGVSFAGGYGYDRAMIEKMQQINGNLPTTTTSTSVIDALHKLGVKKITMAMPYIEEVALAAVRFVEKSGFKVLNKRWLGQPPAGVPRETILALAREVDTPESEATLLSCTGWHTIDVIEQLERELQKPVVSSNQATMWNLLRLAGINDKVEGYGQLFLR